MKTSLLVSVRCCLCVAFAAALEGTAHAADGPGFALGFNASSNYVSVPHTAGLNHYPLTVTAWVNTTQSTGRQGLVNKYVASAFNGWQIYLFNGQVRAWYFVSNTRYVWDGADGLNGGLVADGLWHHLAFTVDASGGKLYVDGVLKDSRVWTGPPGFATTLQEVRLGSYPGGGGAFNGILDEITMWTVALSQAEIQTNMNTSLAGTETDLLLYFRCEDGGGSTVADSAPDNGNNNGTWVGTPLFVISGVEPPLLFTNLNAGLPGTEGGSAAWGDYDNDGRMDLLFSGPSTTGLVAQVWRNTGSGFTKINAGLPQAYNGSGAWGDYDNDGRLDILLTGHTDPIDSASAVCQVWRNTGSGFSNINAGLPGAFGQAVWGDYDNDGRLDILLTGVASNQVTYQVWRNTGSGFTNINAGLPGFFLGSAAWGDYDNEGRLDILLTGLDASNHLFAQVWRNTGSGFTNINAGLPGVYGSSVAWGDYDNDGRLDILLAGATGFTASGVGYPTGFVAQVWRNTGSGFSNINARLSGVVFGSVAWGDYDSDGRPDILLAGADSLNPTNDSLSTTICQIWRNTVNGFTNINAGLPGIYFGSAAWGDYDYDGRLEILLTGAHVTGSPNSFQDISQIWRCRTPLTNSPPGAPTGLAMSFSNNVVTFAWNTAADAQTPASGLTYNLRVGAAPGGGEFVGPMAANNGLRRLPQHGNAQQRLSRSITGLPLSQPFYWSVQAVDGSFAGSAFAAEASFKLLQAPPVVVSVTASNIVPGDLNGDGLLDDSELNALLTNYFANSPWLYLTNVAGLGGTNVTFALTNSLAGAFSVEYTTNLTDWFFLGPATPRYLFTDTNAPAVPQRFYRLRWP